MLQRRWYIGSSSRSMKSIISLVALIVSLTSLKCYCFTTVQFNYNSRMTFNNNNNNNNKQSSTLYATNVQNSNSDNSSPAFFASTTTIEVKQSNNVQQNDASAIAVVVEDKKVDVTLNPYEQIGITEDQLALGVSAADVLKYIGTREQLIEKTMKDIDSFNRIRAEQEVSKFLLDAEMVNMYIQYGKEIERDPNFVVPSNDEEEDGILSFRTLVIAYLAYVAYDSSPKLFRNWVYDQQLTGTWQGTNIDFIDKWIQDTEPMIIASREARAAAAAAAAAANGDGEGTGTGSQSFLEGIATAIRNLFTQQQQQEAQSSLPTVSTDIPLSISTPTESVDAAINAVDSLISNLGISSNIDTSAISDTITSM